jgi:hypothetical protein
MNSSRSPGRAIAGLCGRNDLDLSTPQYRDFPGLMCWLEEQSQVKFQIKP